MSTKNRFNFYFDCLFIFLFWIGISHNIYAQDEPNPSPEAPLDSFRRQANFVIPRTDIESIASYNNIAKTASVSYYPKSFVVSEDKLQRKYYTDNIFDIGASDNPFALPTSANKKTQKEKTEQQNEVAVFSELFATNSTSATPHRIPQWLIFVLLGILSFMSILVAIYKKEVFGSFQAFLSTSSARNAQREQTGFIKIESFSSYILFVLSMGTYCFLIPQILLEESTFNTFGALLLCIMGIGLAYILKHIQLKVVSAILPFPLEVDFYNFTISNTNKILGYVLLPILFLLAYMPLGTQTTVLYGSFGLLGCIYFYRTLKGLAMAGSVILFHKFHFLVYLCAVEIAPLLILLKLLSIL